MASRIRPVWYKISYVGLNNNKQEKYQKTDFLKTKKLFLLLFFNTILTPILEYSTCTTGQYCTVSYCTGRLWCFAATVVLYCTDHTHYSSNEIYCYSYFGSYSYFRVSNRRKELYDSTVWYVMFHKKYLNCRNIWDFTGIAFWYSFLCFGTPTKVECSDTKVDNNTRKVL